MSRVVAVYLDLSWLQRGGVTFSALKVRSLAVNSSPTVRITVLMFGVDPEARLLMIRRNSGGNLVTRIDESIAP